MPAMRDLPNGSLGLAQAADLALLVELEARWENLRDAPSPASEAPATIPELHGKQKAYDAFRSRLAAYNKRYAPPHVPEVLLHTPARLGGWCRQMRELYLLAEYDPHGRCPADLVEKAYRWADRVAGRMKKDRVCRSPAPGTIRAAIEQLEALTRWCEELGRTP